MKVKHLNDKMAGGWRACGNSKKLMTYDQ